MSSLKVYLSALIILLVANSAFAEQLPDPVLHDPVEIEQTEVLNEQLISTFATVISRFDDTHTSISSGLESSVTSMDNFFSDDKSLHEATESYMRIALDVVQKEYGGTGFAGDLKLKADMPRTKKKLKLLIETDAQRGSRDNLNDIPSDVVQQRDFFIALERKIGGQRVWDIRPALGIKVRFPLDTFARVRSYRYIDLDPWLLRASNTFDWFDSRGFGANGALEFDRAVSKNFLFRVSTSLNWREEEMFRRFDQGFSLFQTIDADQNLAYQISGFADDEYDWRANSYYIQARYRKRLYKKWMFGEIIPQWTFLKQTGFHSEPSLTMRLEMVFGEHYR